ncbi:dihydrolipoamide acetyltransferase family protein [Neomicrococcus lactis]|uniref:Dihydrolipoamide acetyltransferase component of pyruvate dehydrogenase complex n=1 Tax=Neomicrococcus lactis TaxID=732241 RepID=A0A7W8YCS5_9MICC|nr:dihydrolipoamide acetyltransferase family protein [Neomicrococcus lactis]MBB5599011.1 pyruvate dehydrogenase E2 component (dihydrolipoamide acetyltransferase) [Neomicrococcus lactis]
MRTFNLPDVGEGLTEAEVVSWKVKPGDSIRVNDIFVEIETAKSLVELPSPFEGVVRELHAAEGDTLEVGAPLFSVDTLADDPNPKTSPIRTIKVDSVPGELVTPTGLTAGSKLGLEEAPASMKSDSEVGPLVGSGPKADAPHRRRRIRPGIDAAAPSPVTTPADSPVAAQEPKAEQAPAAMSSIAKARQPLTHFVNRVLAKPPVRKVARDLGIDLERVTPTGAYGEVTRGDLESYQAQREREQDAAPKFWAGSDQTNKGHVERQTVRGVRKATAKAMVDSAFSAPHVSIFVDVDASRTMEFVQRLKKSRDFEGIKVSPLLILAKAVIWAAARNPSVNASWVDTADGAEIHVKHFMNLGIAAATPRGLMVPNIKDAQNLSLKELAIALNDLASTARAGKTKPSDMQNGTLTVTNIGALGIDTGTPIINPGEVAIVAFGTIRQKPWVVSGEVIPRWITTLGGSFDHRVVDGDLSARFMADVAAIMEEPALLLD